MRLVLVLIILSSWICGFASCAVTVLLLYCPH